jgi:transposase
VSFRGRRCGEVWIAEVKDGSRWLLLVACFGGWDLR